MYAIRSYYAVMAGAAVGAEYGAGLGTAVAPGVGTVVGGVVGGLVGAGVGMLGKYAALSKMPETKAALEEAERQNPTSAFTGQIVSQGVGFGVGAVGRTGAEKLASMTLGGARITSYNVCYTKLLRVNWKQEQCILQQRLL